MYTKWNIDVYKYCTVCMYVCMYDFYVCFMKSVQNSLKMLYMT